jgi:heme-degrading monooxygenase HmoA
MILEVAVLNIKSDLSDTFESAFEEASQIIASMPGYMSHELKKCIEVPHQYLLLVQWETIEAHTPLGFVSLRNIKVGKKYCIISTIRFLQLSIMSLFAKKKKYD